MHAATLATCDFHAVAPALSADEHASRIDDNVCPHFASPHSSQGLQSRRIENTSLEFDDQPRCRNMLRVNSINAAGSPPQSSDDILASSSESSRNGPSFIAVPVQPQALVSPNPRPRRYKSYLASTLVHLVLLLALALTITAPAEVETLVLKTRLDSRSPHVPLTRIEPLPETPLEILELRESKVDVDLSPKINDVELPNVSSASSLPAAVAWPMKLPTLRLTPITSQAAVADSQHGSQGEAQGDSGAEADTGTGEDSGGAGYFSIPINGGKIMFVADASASMQRALGLTRTEDKLAEARRIGLDAKDQKLFMRDPRELGYPSRWQKLTNELTATLESLNPGVEFGIVFFGSNLDTLAADLQIATPENKQLGIHWVQQYRPAGGTDPFPAVAQALSMQPDEIFVLTDGEFAPKTADRISELNSTRTRKARIHTIAMGDTKTTDALQRLAKENDGEFVLARR
ncbi:hypothetical protein RMSM_07179 [Rhodopirellula maiorica SM1]|uniref:VWFA domain-containing protein n=2 Tax=Novipirellula TaxID=2795426 RepID=M5RKK0_9BACT|nr:hypothetical protein RMSM_07179 [Rhodopirellula maiorica SM1]